MIPCATQPGAAAFDELFKAHFAFAVSYDEALCNFYTFIQTTMYGIDVGSVKQSPHVRARIFHSTDEEEHIFDPVHQRSRVTFTRYPTQVVHCYLGTALITNTWRLR